MYETTFYRCTECSSYLCVACQDHGCHGGRLPRFLAKPLPEGEKLRGQESCEICLAPTRARVECLRLDSSAGTRSICFTCFNNWQKNSVRKFFQQQIDRNLLDFRLLTTRYMLVKPVVERDCECLEDTTIINHCNRCNTGQSSAMIYDFR